MPGESAKAGDEYMRLPGVAVDRRTSELLEDLQRTVDAMRMGVVVLDADLRAEVINRAFYDIWKVTPRDVSVGSPFRALMDINRHNGVYDVADDRWEDYVATRLREISAGSVPPKEFRRADGYTMVYEVTELSGGKRLVTYFDISDLKQREAELAEALERAGLADAVIDGINNPVFVKDSQLRFVYVNEAFASMFGVTPAQMTGRRGGDFITSADVAQFEMTERRVLETGEAYEVEEDFEVDGVGKSRIVRKNRIRTGSGNDYVAGFIFDISEIREREAALRDFTRQIDLFRHVLDELPVAAYVKDDDLSIRFVNKAWCALTGIGKDEAAGRSDLDLFGVQGEDFAHRDLAVLSTGIVNETEETLTHRDGSARQLIARKSRLSLDDGTVHLIGSSTDVTELKQREIELEQAQRRAVLADRAKSEFLANMSHEIRTPMNGVLGMAELLSKSSLDAKQRTFTDIILKSGNALLKIINDILDFSKIDAGQLVLDPAPFNLAEAIEDVATLVSTRAKEKDLELIVRVQPDLPALFVGDVGRIRQIITNLLGNAVKFTDSGHVLVDVNGEMDGSVTRLTIAVTDTGIGIPADKLKLVFEKFSQVDGSSTRRHEGTGLGLAITSRLVEMMNGSVEVRSAEGEGSTFTVSLELPVAADQKPRRVAPLDVTGARILVVDDNPVNRAILMEQMRSWAFDACAAQSGPEGLLVLDTTSRLGLKVDCVILDYQMPGMTGADVARAVRANPALADTPLILLTSVDQSLSNKSYRDLDIDAHLIKPARSSVLLDALVTTIQRHRAPPVLAAAPVERPAVSRLEPQVPKPVPARAEGRHRVDILVAEDNEVNQLVFTQILGETGHTFEIVDNGRRALEAFEALQPRMILMDISMPMMNGLEATAAIREREAGGGGRVPIVGVTAHALKGDRERCLEAGMDDYLSKPISPNALLAKVELWMDDRASRTVAG
ncbi:response regulator [Mesorhizobium sp. J428]|uniref:response regulator n=1 Tax=Mesorhizobium sp. J428 TaxID=2898440 RepID=UPI002151E83D|nr:response regulator [Mesorhizobium sp. J428]MCR5856891.1 response regulator [Mesorhizobium sp. J428]